MKRPPLRTRAPRHVRKLKADHWSAEDEDLLRAGVWRYADPHERHAILAERRRLSVDDFMVTIPQRFGGTAPTDRSEVTETRT